MVDIDPTEPASKYAPREANLVDAVAEAKRIADQQMRSNPLKDATIDDGLTRWVGNYGGDLAWFGEFLPYDRNQFDQYGNPLPQRGISFVRDDPLGNTAFAMYDFDPRAGVPLRQRIYFHDADGKPLLWEGYNGGRAFPDTPIVMYQREVIDPTGANFVADRIMYSGEGNLTGTRLEFRGTVTSGGGSTISMFVRVSGGGVTVNSTTLALAGGGNQFVDLDVKAIQSVSDFVTVEWHVWRSAGADPYIPRIFRCRTYSYLTG